LSTLALNNKAGIPEDYVRPKHQDPITNLSENLPQRVQSHVDELLSEPQEIQQFEGGSSDEESEQLSDDDEEIEESE
jgi:hypothetical protein